MDSHLINQLQNAVDNLQQQHDKIETDRSKLFDLIMQVAALNKISLNKLAKSSGVTGAYLSMVWSNERALPKNDLLLKIAKALIEPI